MIEAEKRLIICLPWWRQWDGMGTYGCQWKWVTSVCDDVTAGKGSALCSDSNKCSRTDTVGQHFTVQMENDPKHVAEATSTGNLISNQQTTPFNPNNLRSCQLVWLLL